MQEYWGKFYEVVSEALGGRVNLRMSEVGDIYSKAFEFTNEGGVKYAKGIMLTREQTEGEAGERNIESLAPKVAMSLLQGYIYGTADRLAEAMRKRRKSCGISQKRLAKICGVRQSTISAIESGKVDMHVSTLLAIMFVLGIRFESFG